VTNFHNSFTRTLSSTFEKLGADERTHRTSNTLLHYLNNSGIPKLTFTLIFLRYGGIVSEHLITNLVPNVLVKEFWKSLNIWWRCVKNLLFGLFSVFN